MTKDQKRFFLSATILLAIVISVSQLIFFTFFETKNFPLRIISIVFVWIATCLTHIWLMYTVKDKPKAFIRVFMLQATMKFLLYMVFIACYLLLFRQHSVPFTAHFFVVYIVFAIFEVALILNFVSKNTGSIEKTN